MDAVHCPYHLLNQQVLRYDKANILQDSKLLPFQGVFPYNDHYAHPFFGRAIDNRDLNAQYQFQ
jgi:hypothetical protein